MPKILIIEDEAAIRRVLTKILSEKASESTDKDVILPPPWNPEKYKTYEDYINSKEYKEYLIKKQEQ